MTVVLKKWGNSIALRIPKDIANTLDVHVDSLMELEIENGALIIRAKKESNLETIVSKINDKNLHKEIDTGESVGNEKW